MVEIGVWHGVTSRILRSAMAPDGVLLLVDPFPSGRLGFSAQRLIAQSEVSREANGRVRWVRKRGSEAAAEYAAAGGDPVDFVFLDGDHSYDVVLADWAGWSALVARGGIVALHDSHSTRDRSIDEAGSLLVTEQAVLRDPDFDLVETADSLTVVRRVIVPARPDGIGAHVEAGRS